MKKKIVGIIVCMLLLATTLPVVGTLNKKIETSGAPLTPSGVEWEKTYGGDEFDWFYDVQPTRDGGYIATGITEENNVYYAWLVKVNATGGEEWCIVNHEFFGSQIETNILVSCVRQAPAPDDGYLVGGMGVYYNTFYGYWFVSGYLWKVNTVGGTEWLKPINNEQEEWCYVPFVFESYNDSGWVCAGFYCWGNPSGYTLDVGLCKTNFSGTFLWGEHYDEGMDFEFARSLWNTTDGGYFLSGTSSGFCMIKTDSDGTLQRDAVFDAPGYEYSPTMGCRQTKDGGYIMSGMTDSYGAGGTDLWIIKTDENFSIQWNKTYGGPNNDRNYGMDATSDGGYIFSVIKNASGVSGTKADTWLINTDSKGNIEWELLIEKVEIQWCQPIVQTDNGGFIVAGRTGAIDSPGSDGLIMKIAPFPHIEIDIKGGLGLHVTISNTGKGDALQMPYKLSVNGGLFRLINETKDGTIDLLAGNYKAFLGLYLRVGKVTIMAKAAEKQKTTTGFLLGPFVLVK
jgi:hypothetical protein